MKLLSSSVVIFFILLSLNAFSQDAYLDKLYQDARNNAFSNNYQTARKICYQILLKNNRYLDARILLARTFSWDQKFDSARYHLKNALKQDAYAVDAYLAFADVEMWSKNYAKAVALCDSALTKIPNNYELFIKKIKACLGDENILCARSTIDDLLKVYPLNLEVQELLKKTRQGNYRNRIIAEHTFVFFKKPYIKRWHVTSLQYQHDAKWITTIAKMNTGLRVPSEGVPYVNRQLQYELDVYPYFGNGYYAYMNYGYSEGSMFAKHRGGLELFKSFAKGFEISAGGRYIYFNEYNKALVLTGSLSKYLKAWWFSARPYFSFVDEEYFYQSYFMFIRKYSSQFNYIGGMFGYGISPDLLPNSVGTYDIYDLNSYQARLDIQQRLGKHFLVRSLNGYAYDQYAVSEYRHRFNTQLYLAVMF